MASGVLYDALQLPQDTRSIRVVRLNDQAPIGWGVELDLRVVDFDDAGVDYTALSYMWGDPTQTVSVIINNHPMEITQNLYAFLSEMQLQGRYEWFWIDAVCINQTDDFEKSHQVQMMGEIYKRASSVMIWLGVWVWDSLLIPQLLDKVAKVLRLSDNNGEGKYTMYTPEELDAIRDLCYRPYWERIWTVQERVLASKLSIACGDMHIEWASFSSNLQRHMGDMFTQDNKDLMALNIALRESPAMQVMNKQTSWGSQRDNQGVTIESLLFQYRSLQAYDARDRIYGLLALVTPPARSWLDRHPDYEEPIPILADYTKTPAQLYEQILRLKYPQGAETPSIDPEIVAGILPATLRLRRDDSKVEELIKKYFPNGWDPSWNARIDECYSEAPLQVRMTTQSLHQNESIASHVKNCISGFHTLSEHLKQVNINMKLKIRPQAIEDELGRFQLWLGSVGAHKSRKGSLEYKLRNAFHIRHQVIELLQSLHAALSSAIEILTGVRRPWEDLSDSESDKADDKSVEDVNEETELRQLEVIIIEIITHLLRLSITIQNPAPNDRFQNSSNIDMSAYEISDLDHVRENFPLASSYLIDRFGKAISRRRQNVHCRQEHSRKMKHGFSTKDLPLTGNMELVGAVDVVASQMPVSTVASSIPQAFMTPGLEGINYDYLEQEDDHTQIPYTSSSSRAYNARIPLLPSLSQDGEPFECPICFRLVSIRDDYSWYKHAYRDLRPYACTFRNCEIPDRLYKSRHQWFEHELQKHRLSWSCLDGCDRCFDSASDLIAHLCISHGYSESHDKLQEIVSTCERRPDMKSAAQCALCKKELPSLTQLRSHMGRHQRELAQIALPMLSYEEGDPISKDVEQTITDEGDSDNDSDAMLDLGTSFDK